MAVLHKKEEKIQAVLGRLPKSYTHEQFVAMFIQLFSRDWGRIKSAYIKQTQDKEPGTVVHMPKPDLYLKQVLENFLSQKASLQPKISTTEKSKITEPLEITTQVETDIEPKKAKKKVAKADDESLPAAEVEKPKRKTAVKKTVEEIAVDPVTEPKKPIKKARSKSTLTEVDDENKAKSADKPVKEKLEKEKKASTTK